MAKNKGFLPYKPLMEFRSKTTSYVAKNEAKRPQPQRVEILYSYAMRLPVLENV